MQTQFLNLGYRANLAHYGPKYFSFTRNQIDSSDMVLHLKSEIPMQVYLSSGKTSDPNQFQNDALFKNIKELSLHSFNFDYMQSDGYTITVYIAAIDENAN